MERDPKGLYKKALAGEIESFTGISDPYESPEDPEIHLRTGEETEEESFLKVISYLESNRYIPPTSKCLIRKYTEQDEIDTRRHLVSLGFAKMVADI